MAKERPAAMRSPGAERNERAMTEKCGGPQERIERVPDARIPGSNVLFDGSEVVLAEAEERLYLCDGPSVYGIGSSGYEPCTYLLRGGAVCTVIHNAFSESEIRMLAGHGGTVRSVTGTEYDIGRLCRLLAFAARFADCDIGYAEGKLAVEKLKELGAVSPERAVPPGAVGLRSVPSALSHSKRLKERVMTLEDGRIYVRIRG